MVAVTRYRNRPVYRAVRAAGQVYRAVAPYAGRVVSMVSRQMARTRRASRPPVRQRVAKRARRSYVRPLPKATYAGKFKGKGRKVRASRAQRSGAVVKTEKGGAIIDPQCIYVGHITSPLDVMQKAMFMSFVRRLFEKAGYNVTDWSQAPPFTGSLHLSWYYQIQATGPNLTTSAFTGASSYGGMADALLAAFEAAIASDKVPILHEIALWDTPNTLKLGHLNLVNCQVSFGCYSELTIQNRTTADSSGADINEATNVSNNPLYGTSYMGYGTSFVPLYKNDTLLTYQPFVGSELYGDFVNTAAVSLPVVGRKPPQANFFSGAVKTMSVQVAPGTIKKNVLYSKVSMKAVDFYVRYRAAVDNTTPAPVRVGKIQMFALEKMLNTREADEPDVNVGYEVNTTISCSMSFKSAAPTARVLMTT